MFQDGRLWWCYKNDVLCSVRWWYMILRGFCVLQCYKIVHSAWWWFTRWGQSSVASWWFPHSYYWTICLTMCGHSAATSFNWISYDFPLSSPPLPGHRYLNRISYGLTSITFQGSLAIPGLQIMIAVCRYLRDKWVLEINRWKVIRGPHPSQLLSQLKIVINKVIQIIQTRRKYPFETCRADIQNKGQRKKKFFL